MKDRRRVVSGGEMTKANPEKSLGPREHAAVPSMVITPFHRRDEVGPLFNRQFATMTGRDVRRNLPSRVEKAHHRMSIDQDLTNAQAPPWRGRHGADLGSRVVRRGSHLRADHDHPIWCERPRRICSHTRMSGIRARLTVL